MVSLGMLEQRLSMIEEQSYYEILRVPSGAPASDIKAAFHDFALDVHPDRYVDAAAADARVAAEIFKRGVEAYKVLANPVTRASYDEGLLDGRLRYVEGRQAPAAPIVARTLALEELAVSPRAKQHALRADRLIAAGRFDDARVALVTAIQEDYDNDELKSRLNALYQRIAAEPLTLDVDRGRRR